MALALMPTDRRYALRWMAGSADHLADPGCSTEAVSLLASVVTGASKIVDHKGLHANTALTANGRWLGIAE